jgi:aminomethyltransferase
MQNIHDLKKTPLYQKHVDLGARMVEFNGWHMPVSYTKVINEHKHVRSACGIFDVSHMGEIFVSGKEAKHFLQTLLINDIDLINPGQGQYTALLNKAGGMIDDLIVYQLESNSYLLCVNAGNVEKDFKWIQEHSAQYSELSIKNESFEYAQLAIQGPKSYQV